MGDGGTAAGGEDLGGGDGGFVTGEDLEDGNATARGEDLDGGAVAARSEDLGCIFASIEQNLGKAIFVTATVVPIILSD